MCVEKLKIENMENHCQCVWKIENGKHGKSLPVCVEKLKIEKIYNPCQQHEPFYLKIKEQSEIIKFNMSIWSMYNQQKNIIQFWFS